MSFDSHRIVVGNRHVGYNGHVRVFDFDINNQISHGSSKFFMGQVSGRDWVHTGTKLLGLGFRQYTQDHAAFGREVKLKIVANHEKAE